MRSIVVSLCMTLLLVPVALGTADPREERVVLGTPVESTLAWAAASGPAGGRATAIDVLPDDPEAIRISLPSDGVGTYVVAWSVLGVNGQPMSGTRTVRVGAGAPLAQAIVPRGHDDLAVLAILAVIARTLLLIGVLGTLGMAVTRQWVLGAALRSGGIAAPGDTDAPARRERANAVAPGPVCRWWRVWWGMEAAWIAGVIAALTAQVARLGLGAGDVMTLLGDTRWGRGWVALASLGVLAAALALIVRRRDAGYFWSGLRAGAMAAPGVVGAAVLSWSGHAATGSDTTLGITFSTLHGWATAVWLGGLVMLAVLAVPLLRALAPHDRVHMGAAVVVRFSAMAIGAVVVLVITGVYRTLAELPSIDALWTTTYGVALVVKLAIFAFMLVLASWNRVVLHPRLERAALGIGDQGAQALGALRASIRAEVVLAAAVCVAVAVLVSIPPPV